MKRRREPVNVEDRVFPTPETVAKLLPDQLRVMFDAGQLTPEHIEAANEVRTIYFAVVGNLLARAHDYDARGGRSTLPDWLAAAHATRYKPWANDMGSGLSAIIDCLIDGKRIPPKFLADSLADYAARMAPVRVRHTIMATPDQERFCS